MLKMKCKLVLGARHDEVCSEGDTAPHIFNLETLREWSALRSGCLTCGEPPQLLSRSLFAPWSWTGRFGEASSVNVGPFVSFLDPNERCKWRHRSIITFSGFQTRGPCTHRRLHRNSCCTATHCKQFRCLLSLLSTDLESHMICGINSLDMHRYNLYLNHFYISKYSTIYSPEIPTRLFA